jgi:RimJ/RimL family protein N-acetyltransferase
MLRLRPYKSSDAKFIVSWMQDQKAFAMWCADKFRYPLTEAQLHRYKEKYDQDENAWLMTALDTDGTPVGHLLMRLADYQNESIHLGFIIVDSRKRGRGYGRQMIALAIQYAFEILHMSKITLGVFDNNPAAHNCYKTAGFIDERYEANVFAWQNELWGLYDMSIEKDLLPGRASFGR